MHPLAAILGIMIIALVLWEAFETIILPRRVQRRWRITRFFYQSTWFPFRGLARRIRKRQLRDSVLAMFGPASLLALFIFWAIGIIAGYALLEFALRLPLTLNNGLRSGFTAFLYLTGSTFFTLSLGDVAPGSPLARFITVVEAGNGLAFLAVVISYLPTLYSSFSEREINISLLDARAGSPASACELLRRHALFGDFDKLNDLLKDWENWSAALMESHISYPVLCYFRSQHTNQSWVAALTAVLDSSALAMTGIEGLSPWQARLTFAMCRHALVDIAQVFHRAPVPLESDRLPPAEFTKLRDELAAAHVNLNADPNACTTLKLLRDMYEPYAFALSEFLLMPLPPWTKPADAKDNWTTSAWKVTHG